MQIKIQNLWYRLRGSFWFLPALMAVAAILFSFTTTTIDRVFLGRQNPVQWLLYSGGPDGARAVLSTIAGSMITVAGVVFSITIVVLTLASSQFGPRLVKNFMNVRANQIVLGTFVATFIYSVLVLHTVNAVPGETFVPGLSVTMAIVIAQVVLVVGDVDLERLPGLQSTLMLPLPSVAKSTSQVPLPPPAMRFNPGG